MRQPAFPVKYLQLIYFRFLPWQPQRVREPERVLRFPEPVHQDEREDSTAERRQE